MYPQRGKNLSLLISFSTSLNLSHCTAQGHFPPLFSPLLLQLLHIDFTHFVMFLNKLFVSILRREDPLPLVEGPCDYPCCEFSYLPFAAVAVDLLTLNQSIQIVPYSRAEIGLY
jgi:hypothetical protein